MLHDAFVHGVRKRVHANLSLLADLHTKDFRFGDVDPDVDLVALEQRGDGSVGSDQVTRADIEYLHRGSRGGDHLALAETRFVVGIGGFGRFDVLAAVAVLKLFERGLGLFISGLCGGNLFRPIADL